MSSTAHCEMLQRGKCLMRLHNRLFLQGVLRDSSRNDERSRGANGGSTIGKLSLESFPIVGDIAQLGRAPALQAGGQGFEPPCLHQECTKSNAQASAYRQEVLKVFAGVTQLVEYRSSKPDVASSSLVARSSFNGFLAQSVERRPYKP